MPEISPHLIMIPIGAYLLGSIPFGMLFTRLFGCGDVRKGGSGNIGATNVARVAGPIPAVLTLLFDVAKGAVPVWLAGRVTSDGATWMMIAALAGLLGHCFPIWLKFRGGKGVATAAGAFLVLCPPALLGSVMLFLIVLFFWRYVSLASISATAAMPLLIYLLWAPHHAPPLIVTFGALAAALIIIYKHDANIQRLVQGEEPKFLLRGKKDVG
jgi:acyl phosphate:glycerol-3-phosphate acyltransferase